MALSATHLWYLLFTLCTLPIAEGLVAGDSYVAARYAPSVYSTRVPAQTATADRGIAEHTGDTVAADRDVTAMHAPDVYAATEPAQTGATDLGIAEHTGDTVAGDSDVTATYAPEVYAATEPAQTGAADLGAIVAPEVLVTSAPIADHTGDAEDGSVTAANEDATSEIENADPRVHAPLRLVCPSVNPERFIATTWYLVPNRNSNGSVELYRIDAKGTVSNHSSDIAQGLNVTHILTRNKDLMIYSHACDYTAEYQCTRSARVGRGNRVHKFSVGNCTVSSRKAEAGPDGTEDTSSSLKNTAMALTFCALMVSVVPIALLMSDY
ncbi:hypothetical protein KUCAC02_025126 [Chaenocephalus aceratus]|nr:hypothetical protein KUCAC02_033102 [Chaenocephalus aceratus]KAI4797397.1 hypothetical protein KUCAC02_025126 [Chaenocephalus aceratus]